MVEFFGLIEDCKVDEWKKGEVFEVLVVFNVCEDGLIIEEMDLYMLNLKFNF